MTVPATAVNFTTDVDFMTAGDSTATGDFGNWCSVRTYLDHNATTPLCSEAREGIVAALDVSGNPSSTHEEGREARDLVETARRDVASLVNAAPADLVFTSGGTESDSLGIIGSALAAQARGRPAHVVTAGIEHPATLGACRALESRGFRCSLARVDSAGRIDLNHFEELCKEGVALAGFSLANHELGTVQAIDDIAAVAAGHDVLLHCDAVQAAGKMAIDVAAAGERGVSSLALSGHKIHGPKGIGALWVRRDVDLGPLIPAGHQERERRPGTENLPGAVGFGAAAVVAARLLGQARELAALTAELEAGLLAIPGVRIHAADAPRIGNTVNAGIDGALGEAVAAALDLAGFSVSTGAACTSGSVEPSPVLLAIGLSPGRAREAVRFSLGRGNTSSQIRELLEVLPSIIARARQFR